MKRAFIALFSIFFFVIGLILYAKSREWIIIQRPLNKSTFYHKNHQAVKKTISFYFWHSDTWQRETVELIWPEDSAQRLNLVVSKWLAIIFEEHLYEKRISLQAALISDTQEAYLSFDRNPIIKSQSTLYNLMWFEGLLKTVRDAHLVVCSIHFMTHHHPIHDAHLDFSRSWPIAGFVQP